MAQHICSKEPLQRRKFTRRQQGNCCQEGEGMDMGPHRRRIARPEVARHGGAIRSGKHQRLSVCNGVVQRRELQRFVADS